jgi:hypothetical protein
MMLAELVDCGALAPLKSDAQTDHFSAPYSLPMHARNWCRMKGCCSPSTGIKAIASMA